MRTFKLTKNKEALTFKVRFIRTLWSFVYLTLFKPSPRIFHPYRAFLLRIFGAKIGCGVHVYPAAKIWYPYNLYLEDHASIDEDVDVYNVDIVHLKKNAKVSKRTFLCTASHSYLEESRVLLTAPIIIGEDAWVAAEAFIGPGVVIGDRAKILARVSVNEDVPANIVVRKKSNYTFEKVT